MITTHRVYDRSLPPGRAFPVDRLWPRGMRKDAHRDAWAPLAEAAREGDVVLLYGARDTEHNNDVALRQYLVRHVRGAAQPHHPA
jgi:uncharacterized protein YeaO (DUF488 family)